MAIVEVEKLVKYYRVHKKEEGLLGSFQSLMARKYEEVRAVDGLSFQIEEGELLGFIGPNGAGKTTTLKILSGLLYPTTGFVSVLGFTPWQRKTAFLKNIALVMGQKNQLLWDLPAGESFALNKEIYELGKEEYERNLDELVSLLGVGELLKVQVRKLSLGQRMKMELIAALLHRPKVLFLDEPTIGLDVVASQKMRDFIRGYNRKFEATIILTSHYMEDVLELCKRVIIIDKGKIRFDGELSEVVKRYGRGKRIELVLGREVNIRELAELVKEEGGELRSYDFPKAVVKVKRGLASRLAARVLKRFPVADLNIEEPRIEEIIRQIFENSGKA